MSIEVEQSDNECIWFDPELVEGDPRHYFDIHYWHQQAAVTGSAKGRGTTFFLRGPKMEMALRHYYRGGLFGKLVKDQYWFTGWETTRCGAELTLLAYLRAKKLPVPRPVAARAVKSGRTYRADILVEKVPGARDLVAILCEHALLAHDYRAIGRLVRRLHDAGVCHTDLNIHNILRDKKGKLWLIDFDKCQQRDGEQWKEDNLARLHRSFKKEKEKRQIHWQPEDWAAVLKGYNKIRK